MKKADNNTIAMADSFMAIFGFKRKAIIRGNVIEPTAFEVELPQCDICGDHHEADEVPRECETGDGV